MPMDPPSGSLTFGASRADSCPPPRSLSSYAYAEYFCATNNYLLTCYLVIKIRFLILDKTSAIALTSNAGY